MKNHSKLVFLLVLLGLAHCDSSQEKDDHFLPKNFALKSIELEKYATLSFDNQHDLVVKSDTIDLPEMFEAVDAPISTLLDSYFTVVAIRSVYNNKFVIINDDKILSTREDNLDDAEKFIVYFGPGKRIGLKSKLTEKFVTIENITDEQTLVSKSTIDSDFLVFEYEPVEHISKLNEKDAESRDDVNSQQVSTEVNEIRSKFPKVFVLKSKSTGQNIRINKDNLAEPLYAQTNENDDWETFEIIYFPESGKEISENATVVGLLSYANEKYLSCKDDKLVAGADKLGDNEKFLVYYGPENSISLKSKKNGKFLSAHSGAEKPLTFDQNESSNTEVFDIVKMMDRSDFPIRFSLQSVANGHFIRVDQDASSPIKADSINENDNVVFEEILVQGQTKNLGQNETIIGIKSIFNGKFLSAKDQEDFNLLANADNLGETEQFLVYYGPNDIIGLKSKSSGKFISAYPNKKKPLYVNRDHFKNWEMFKIIEVLDKKTFPKLFSLKAKSNGKFIKVENENANPLHASADSSYENTAFEAILFPDSDKKPGENEVLIALRSYSNGKLLSAKDQNNYSLVADADSISETEKFLVYYGANNIVGLKSKASGKYVSADPNKNKPLYVNRDHFKDWEMFEIVPY